MKEHKINKFEHPVRMAELDPKNTLKRAGFKEGMKLIDIGAGTGMFSFPAAEISDSDIYALDISDEMIEIVEERKAEGKIENLKVLKVESDRLPIEDEVGDFAIMITVLHELEKPAIMLKEIKRVLKEEGRLLIVEFYKEDTKWGPPENHRISEEKVDKLTAESGFEEVNRFSLGENLYGVVYRNK